MCRRETRFASSILFWMSLWVLGLGIGGILLITGFVRIQMRHNIEKNITEEMEKVRDNSLLYVHQILLLNDAVVEEEGFRQCIRAVEEQIKSAGYREAAYYDLDGNLLKGSGSRFDGGNDNGGQVPVRDSRAPEVGAAPAGVTEAGWSVWGG